MPKIVLGSSFAPYLAGLIDGEGNFCVEICLRKNWRRPYYGFRAKLVITNSDHHCLHVIKNILGEGCINIHKPFKTHHRPCAALTLGVKTLRVLLPQILPYLLIKQERAKLVLQLIELTKRNGVPKEEFYARQEEKQYIFNRMRQLNKKGLPNA